MSITASWEMPCHPLPSQPSSCDALSITGGSSHRVGEDRKEEEEARRYQEFQRRQVQSLLELREAQADAEAERRLEHLRQVRGVVRERLLLGQTCQEPVSPAGHPCPQALQRLREIVLEAHTTQVKRLKEMNDR